MGGRNEWANIDLGQLVCTLVDARLAHYPAPAARFPHAAAARGAAAESLITYVADRPGHDRRYAIDASKIENELGFVSQETFETGIRKTVDWFLSNESCWRSVMDGSYRNWIDTTYGHATESRRTVRSRHVCAQDFFQQSVERVEFFATGDAEFLELITHLIGVREER